jgi:hypothetical protein
VLCLTFAGGAPVSAVFPKTQKTAETGETFRRLFEGMIENSKAEQEGVLLRRG